MRSCDSVGLFSTFSSKNDASLANYSLFENVSLPDTMINMLKQITSICGLRKQVHLRTQSNCAHVLLNENNMSGNVCYISKAPLVNAARPCFVVFNFATNVMIPGRLTALVNGLSLW